MEGDGSLTDKCLASLPYELTGCQRRAVEDAWADMASSHSRMVRLLQGDVGSGKTVWCVGLAPIIRLAG
jgi:ATP-dependent DNA helicase RecG